MWLTNNIRAIFTDSALWAGSVIESPCLSVCLFVSHKVVIVDNGQCITYFFIYLFIFKKKIERLCMVLKILNIEDCMKLHDRLKS